MANNRINLLEKKVPFNISIRRVIKEQFELKCLEYQIDKNSLIESLMFEYLNELERQPHDPTK